jgi:heme exporter protein B
MNRAVLAMLRRDMLIGWRQGGGAAAALSFVLSVLVLVPLAVGPDQNLLQRIAPGIIWLTLLLAVLLTAERIFQQDYEDGSVDALALSPQPLELLVCCKAIAHWLSVGLPLALALPFIAIMLNVMTQSIPVLLVAMVLGSLSLSLLASIGGALTAGLRRGGLLLTLLILPLYVPVLVFGVSASLANATPQGPVSSLVILAAIALLALAVQPWAAAAALRAYLR